jgi:hypothetical protein
MAYTVDAYAYQIVSGSEAMFNLKQALSASGWKISGSSDATSYDANGDILTNGAMLEATNAWFTVVAPDDTRQWSFQRGSANTTWTIKRSKAGMSGAVNATTPPADGNAATLVNNEVFFTTNIGNWLVSVVSSSVNVSSSFYAFNVPLGGGNVYSIIYDEPMLSGSYNPLDQDPHISYANYYSTGYANGGGKNFDSQSSLASLGEDGRHIKRVKHNMSSPANQPSFASIYGEPVSPFNSVTWAPPVDVSNTLNLSPYDSKEATILVPYGRSVYGPPTYSGFWGYGTHVRYGTTLKSTRSNGQTMDATSRYYIFAAGWWFPWDSSTPAI